MAAVESSALTNFAHQRGRGQEEVQDNETQQNKRKKTQLLLHERRARFESVSPQYPSQLSQLNRLEAMRDFIQSTNLVNVTTSWSVKIWGCDVLSGAIKNSRLRSNHVDTPQAYLSRLLTPQLQSTIVEELNHKKEQHKTDLFQKYGRNSTKKITTEELQNFHASEITAIAKTWPISKLDIVNWHTDGHASRNSVLRKVFGYLDVSIVREISEKIASNGREWWSLISAIAFDELLAAYRSLAANYLR